MSMNPMKAWEDTARRPRALDSSKLLTAEELTKIVQEANREVIKLVNKSTAFNLKTR